MALGVAWTGRGLLADESTAAIIAYYSANIFQAMSLIKRAGIASTSLAILIIGSAMAEKALAGDCKWHKDESGSYCIIPRSEAGTKAIEVILRSSREGTKVMTYRGKTFARGAIFIDDEYNGKHILKYYGADKIVLQDKNGNPPEVYLR